MEEAKKHYLRTLLILDDIESYHSQLSEIKDDRLNLKFKLIRNSLIPLHILNESLSDFGRYIKDSNSLIEKSRALKKRLEFVNHIRNKISGHIESKVLEKAVQWEPTIFYGEVKGKTDFQLSLTYKAILESGINSYIDEEGRQKVFNREIDLFYPPDTTLFYNFLGELNVDSIDLLTSLLGTIESNIHYWTEEEKMKIAIKAGETDFNLKNK